MVAWCGWSTKSFNWLINAGAAPCGDVSVTYVSEMTDHKPVRQFHLWIKWKVLSQGKPMELIDINGDDSRGLRQTTKIFNRAHHHFPLQNGPSGRSTSHIESIRNDDLFVASSWVLSTRIYPFGCCIFKMLSIPQHTFSQHSICTSDHSIQVNPRIRKVLSHARHPS